MAESLIKFSKNKILIDRREPKRVTDSLWNNWLWQMVFYVGPTTSYRPPSMLYILMAGWRVDNLACSTQCLIVSYFEFWKRRLSWIQTSLTPTSTLDFFESRLCRLAKFNVSYKHLYFSQQLHTWIIYKRCDCSLTLCTRYEWI